MIKSLLVQLLELYHLQNSLSMSLLTIGKFLDFTAEFGFATLWC